MLEVKRQFADADGGEIRMNGEQYTVVGVLAPGATDRLQTQMYVPLAFKPDQINHNFHFILVMARMKAGVTLAQANAAPQNILALLKG